MTVNAIQIHKGNHGTWLLTVYDENDDTIDLTGAGVIFTVKKTKTTPAVSVQRRSPDAGGSINEIEILDQVTSPGQCYVKIIPANTRDLDAGDYVYDVKVIIGGQEKTVVDSKFTLLEAVTP